jgi:hypothetical protein
MDVCRPLSDSANESRFFFFPVFIGAYKGKYSRCDSYRKAGADGNQACGIDTELWNQNKSAHQHPCDRAESIHAVENTHTSCKTFLFRGEAFTQHRQGGTHQYCRDKKYRHSQDKPSQREKGEGV